MVDRLGTIARDLGRMLEALAGLIFVSVLVPLVWGEFWVVPAMVVSGLIPLVVGLTLRRTFEHAADPGRLHGMMIAASGWFLVAAFGSVPFLLAAWTAQLDPGMLDVPARFTVPGTRTFSTLAAFQNPLNWFFESMS
ncbi:TrkH family potassium uptake protein, partial [Halobacterium salinarum]|nr:TrkH family potassium uptake protein [Halobacterium salinarum]